MMLYSTSRLWPDGKPLRLGGVYLARRGYRVAANGPRWYQWDSALAWPVADTGVQGGALQTPDE